MSTANPDHRLSASLLHQASKGKFFTRKAKVAGSTGLPKASGENPPALPDRTPSRDGTTTLENIAQMCSDERIAPALAADRVQYNPTQFFSAQPKRQELRITAAAARALTRVVCVLALDPGAGPEVPLETRTSILDTLVQASHQLADALTRAVVGKDAANIPIYLRAKLLQQSVEFICEQWQRDGNIDTASLLQMAHAVFNSEISGINQDVVDLFHLAEEYTPATTHELSQAKITESVTRASWHLYQQVQRIDLRQFDPDLSNADTPGTLEAPEIGFSWGRDAYMVARDLTKIALSIAKENAIDIDDLDMATTWTQNAIRRASMLVQAEYRMISERALRSSFSQPMLSEARIGRLYDLYDEMLARVHRRARQSYISVETNAVDAMSANAYTSYLPKRGLSEQNGKQDGKQDGEVDEPVHPPQGDLSKRESEGESDQASAWRFRFKSRD